MREKTVRLARAATFYRDQGMTWNQVTKRISADGFKSSNNRKYQSGAIFSYVKKLEAKEAKAKEAKAKEAKAKAKTVDPLPRAKTIKQRTTVESEYNDILIVLSSNLPDHMKVKMVKTIVS